MGCEGVGEWPKHSHGQTASARLPWSCPKVLSSRAAWGLEGAQAPSRSWSHLTGRSSIPETNPLFSSHPWHRRVTDKPVLCFMCETIAWVEFCKSGSGGCISEGRLWGQGRASGLLRGFGEQRWSRGGSFGSWGREQHRAKVAPESIIPT